MTEYSVKKKREIHNLTSLLLRKKENEFTNGTIPYGIIKLLQKSLTEGNSKGVIFVLQYYGLLDENGKTLDEIGKSADKELTRERVRQLIKDVTINMQDAEKYAHESEKAFSKAKAWYSRQRSNGKDYVCVDENIFNDSALNGFKKGDVKGLAAFLVGVDVHTIMNPSGVYFYNGLENRLDIEHKIKCDKKIARRSLTEEKASKMKKTVTYVPPAIRSDLLGMSKLTNIQLNRLYELILNEFKKSKPWSGHPGYFEKTKSWKARKGGSDWVQIGLLITKDDFDMARGKAESLGCSLMAYIAAAFAWATSEDPKAEKVLDRLLDIANK